MKIDARLTFNTVRFDSDKDAHLVLSITAPPVNTDNVRPKLAMIMCIDTSSSMAGQKLEYAKQSVLKMIEHLKGDDVFGVVSFDSQVCVIAQPVRLEGKKDEMRKAVSKLVTSGMTNFAGGMIKSLDLLKDLDLGSNYLHRVIMFTDGQANVGPAKEPDKIIQLLTANMEHITVSAFGYGSGTADFSPGFLTEFAKEGKGNYAHVEDPDKALKAFGTELGGLISTYATDLMLEVRPLNGHSVEKVISDVDVDEENTGEVIVKIPDLLAEETRHIVLSVKLAKQKVHGPRAVNAFEVSAKYLTFDAQGKKESHTTEAKGKIQFVKDGEQDKPNADLDQIVGLAQLVRAQLEAEEQAKKGHYVEAQAVMAKQAADFRTRGRVSLASASASLGNRVASASLHAENSGYLRSFARGASRGMGVASYSAGAEEDLVELGVQTSNSTQTSTSASFTGNSVDLSGGTVFQGGTIFPGVSSLTVNAGTVVPPPAVGAIWMGPPPASAPFVMTIGYPNVDPNSIQPIVPAPLPTNEAKQDDDKKSSKKPLKQSRKSW